jgi:lysophospholipase L1-like esterase
LLRFLQEVDQYHPDLLLVSFGWNDAAEAVGQPDKTFLIPPSFVIASQRVLIRYRAYLVLMSYTQRWREPYPVSSTGPSHPRVSVEDYLANLDRFRAEAEARGIPIAFLTRPHRMTTAELRRHPTWRKSVPTYNAALIAWAREQSVPTIDAQGYFEQLPATFFTDECHFTPLGYKILAEVVSERLATDSDGSLCWAKAEGNGSREPHGLPVMSQPRSSLPNTVSSRP